MADAQPVTQDMRQVTEELQTQDNKPAGQAPANMRETYSILETGEVVAIGMQRTGRGSSAQLDPWVWRDKEKRWELAEQAYSPEIAEQLVEGMNRYERVLRKDPKRAAILRQRSDSTVDGHPNQDQTQTMARQAAQAGANGQPAIAEQGEPPNILGSQ